MKIKSLIKHNLMRAAMTLALILACATAWAQTTENVSYIDADGNTQTHQATVLTGSESSLGSNGQASWYVVNSNIVYSSTITVSGEVHLILSDNTEMTVTTSGNCISATAP